jgi:hypothetical protein
METDRIELLEGLARLAYCHLEPLSSVGDAFQREWRRSSRLGESETIQEYRHIHTHTRTLTSLRSSSIQGRMYRRAAKAMHSIYALRGCIEIGG